MANYAGGRVIGTEESILDIKLRALVRNIEETTRAPKVESVAVGTNHVDLAFDRPITLTSPGMLPDLWTIAGGGVRLTVKAVALLDDETLRLGVTEQTDGAPYVLTVPEGVVLSKPERVPNAAEAVSFDGSGVGPTIVSIAPESLTSILVTFSKDVADGAFDASRYAVSGGIVVPDSVVVRAARRVGPRTVRLQTDKLSPGAIYSVTATGVLDAAGNPS